MISIKYRSVWFWITAAIIVLSIVLMIVGPVMKGFAERTYVPGITVVLVFAVVVQVAGELLDIKVLSRVLPLVATVLFAVVFGLIAYNGALIIADHYNNLNWQNGDYGAVVTYLVLSGICCGLSAANCFAGDRK